MLDSDQFHLVDSGRLVGSLRVCKEHGRQRWGQICRVFLCQARRTSEQASERASRSAPARQRNAWRPCLARRPSRWSCAFKGRAGCSGRWWCGGGGNEGIQAQGVVVMTMTWVWTDGVQLMMNNYARFFFLFLISLFFLSLLLLWKLWPRPWFPGVWQKTRNDFDEWRLNGVAENPVRRGNNTPPLRQGRCHFVIRAPRVICI